MRLNSLLNYTGSVRQWHWISSALCLFAMLAFAVTGITLNHAADIDASPQIYTLEITLPDSLSDQLRQTPTDGLPEALLDFLQVQHQLQINPHAEVQWSSDELYVALPRPGGDAWLSVDLNSGDLVYERTTRGVIAYVNDLHKGRNSGPVWSWFIDLFAFACVVFCLSGLLLLYRYAGPRPTTWPLVGLGVVVPLVVVIMFVHP